MSLTRLSAWRTHMAMPGEIYQVWYRSSSGCYEASQFKSVVKGRGVTIREIEKSGNSIRVAISPGRQNQLSHMIGDILTAGCSDPWTVNEVFQQTSVPDGSGGTDTVAENLAEPGIFGSIWETITAPFTFIGQTAERGFGLLQLALIGVLIVLVVLVLRGDKILREIPKVQAG